MAENQYDFPTEVLDLPSKGLLYPKDSPLSSGKIEIKYMTAKEEDILTSTNLLEKGLAITKLLESIIADPKIKLDDILLGDKNAIMIGARILGYGKDYEVSVTDPDTKLQEKTVVDLTTIKHKEIDYSLIEGSDNKFSFTLPNSKRIAAGPKALANAGPNDLIPTIKGLKPFLPGNLPNLTCLLFTPAFFIASCIPIPSPLIF